MSDPVHDWLDSKDAPAVEHLICRVASPQSFIEDTSRQSSKGTSSRRTTTSSSSRYTSATDASSRNPSASTFASSAPSEYGPIMDAVLHAELPCQFEFAGCSISFPSNAIEIWIAHSLYHFVESDPPMKSICTICDDEGSVFESNGKAQHERVASWRLRMEHIANHFLHGVNRDDVRPDYFLVKYMEVQGLLSREDYSQAMSKSFSERPRGHQAFVTNNFKAPETLRKERRDNIIVRDQRQEDRQRRKGTVIFRVGRYDRSRRPAINP